MKTWKRSIASLVWPPRGGNNTPCTLFLGVFWWFRYELLPFELLLCWPEEEGAKGEQQREQQATITCFVHGLMAVLYSRCSFLWLCLLLLCSWPSVFTGWVRLEGITVESPGSTSLFRQRCPRGLLRPCLIVVTHAVRRNLLLHVDLLTATEEENL